MPIHLTDTTQDYINFVTPKTIFVVGILSVAQKVSKLMHAKYEYLIIIIDFYKFQSKKCEIFQINILLVLNELEII